MPDTKAKTATSKRVLVVLKSLWSVVFFYEDIRTQCTVLRHTSLAATRGVLGMKENVNDLSVWPKFPVHKQQIEVRAGLYRKSLGSLLFDTVDNYV